MKIQFVTTSETQRKCWSQRLKNAVVRSMKIWAAASQRCSLQQKVQDLNFYWTSIDEFGRCVSPIPRSFVVLPTCKELLLCDLPNAPFLSFEKKKMFKRGMYHMLWRPVVIKGCLYKLSSWRVIWFPSKAWRYRDMCVLLCAGPRSQGVSSNPCLLRLDKCANYRTVTDTSEKLSFANNFSKTSMKVRSL